MSERSFALGCVGLALAFGMVVPDPGKAPRQPAASNVVGAHPVAQQVRVKAVDRLDVVPLAVNHAAPAKPDATASLLWAVRNTR